MQAKKGSGFWGRRRSGLIGCVIALVALSAMIIPSIASAQAKEKYLALGDSLAFGYSTQQYHQGEARGYENPELFDHGYVNDYFKSLVTAAKKASVAPPNLQNDGCPGETTESMIGENATLIGTLNAQLKTSQEEHGLPPVTGEEPLKHLPNCEYQEAWQLLKTVGKGGPLHHSYAGTSQLEDALETIRVAKNVEKIPVTTISLNIGANDELHTLGKVEGEAKAAVELKIHEAVIQYFVEHKAELEQEGKEAAEQYFGEHQAELEQEGKEAAEAYFVAHQAELEQEGKEAGEAYYAAHKAELEQEGKEYVEGKVAAAVFQECTEQAETETGESSGPVFEAAREKCLTTEGEQKGNEYYFAHKAELEQEAQEFIEAKLKKVGEEAVGAKLAKVGQEAVEAKLAKVGKEAVEAKLAAYGAKYFAENKFKLGAEGEAIATAKIKEKVPALFRQINSNLSGILLAIRDAGSLGLKTGGKNDVNYTGRIIFQGGYNPFGKLFHYAFEGVEYAKAAEALGGVTDKGGIPWSTISGRCAVHAETEAEEKTAIESGCIAAAVHIGFNGLAGLLNLSAFETAHGGYAACVTDPLQRFDPQNQKKPALEAERLKLWTNMTNKTITEVETEPAVFVKKYNGPDIHPTPAGYKELAAEMTKSAKTTCHTDGSLGF